MKISNYFVRRTVNDREIYSLVDDAPEWLYDACRDAHDGEWPDDWRWQRLAWIANDLDELDFDDPYVEDRFYEIAEHHIDIYTSDLNTWYTGDPGRSSYLDEWLENAGPIHDSTELTRALMSAQCLCLERMVWVLVTAMREALEDSTV